MNEQSKERVEAALMRGRCERCYWFRARSNGVTGTCMVQPPVWMGHGWRRPIVDAIDYCSEHLEASS